MLTADGRCKTLDASGDGYVRAETCVVLLLEELNDVELPAAIFKGSSVNQVWKLASQRLAVGSMGRSAPSYASKYNPLNRELSYCELVV